MRSCFFFILSKECAEVGIFSASDSSTFLTINPVTAPCQSEPSHRNRLYGWQPQTKQYDYNFIIITDFAFTCERPGRMFLCLDGKQKQLKFFHSFYQRSPGSHCFRCKKVRYRFSLLPRYAWPRGQQRIFLGSYSG